ncbi:hypothetical protein M9458_046965 [Cirrhinus mrigala]|uniref:ribonuclease H n=1 Tax=Cirrhinus mrigala TaxID=683832 RepID=A0ABD0NBB3_CIRMR
MELTLLSFCVELVLDETLEHCPDMENVVLEGVRKDEEYNLIRIREGDEWKIAFSTSTGHYEYCVMPFGLANSPSVFQSFINDSTDPTDASRISFVCSLLTDKALEWATAVWGTDGSIFPTFDYFLRNFREVFDHPTGGKSAGEQLLVLTQGEGTAAEFALAFRTLAAQTTWVEDTLKLLFRRGLNAVLQAELACRDEGRSLKDFIELTIRIDQFDPFATSPTASFSALHSEPMQIRFTRLTPEERERRMRLRLCLYCGKPGHLRSTCPTRPGSPGNHAVSSNFPHFHSASCVVIPVKLTVTHKTIEVDALIDSGAAGNFMVTALTEDIIMQVDTHHSETLRFYVIHSPNHQLILGLPWLREHDPHISWSLGEIQQWGPHCPSHCIPAEPTVPENVATCTEPLISVPGLPTEYHDLALAFSKHKASQLPPHRPSDCAIDLIPGSTPPKGRIFPLSQPESEPMKKYIEEELAKGFIRPSTSPATAGFFFVKKKDGTLRPCIDYRGLNDITIKLRYPLPLVPAALEQLRWAKYFTKLDLRAAYNLIRIREGDEWKIALSTSTGHYEYCVMPFGLANSPSVFQSFINDVFRDMLDRCVIVYIDDMTLAGFPHRCGSDVANGSNWSIRITPTLIPACQLSLQNRIKAAAKKQLQSVLDPSGLSG